MKNKIVKQAKKFLLNEYEKAPLKTKQCFKGHFKAVEKYAKQFSKGKNIDKEVVLLSVWLHDIASVKGQYKDHHIKGAKIAEKFLSKNNYPKEKIKKIKNCILVHRGSKPRKNCSREAQILINADAIAHFDNITPLFKAYKTKQNVLAKLQRSYNKLSPEAKKIMKNKLEKAKKELAEIKIKQLNKRYLNEIVDLHKKTIFPLWGKLKRDYTEKEIIKYTKLTLKKGKIFGAIKGEKLVGCIGIFLNKNRKIGQIKLLLVYPKYQKKEIGKKLIDYVERYSDKKVKKLQLEVLKDNKAVNFYEKLGYKKFSYIMEKQLK
jgi:uncharacterized protein